MTHTEFRATLNLAEPPSTLSDALQALWWDAKGDWHRAHECAQRDEGRTGSMVHAYLHRKEGDQANARGWYRRAGRTPAEGSLESEWDALAQELLQGGSS